MTPDDTKKYSNNYSDRKGENSPHHKNMPKKINFEDKLKSNKFQTPNIPTSYHSLLNSKHNLSSPTLKYDFHSSRSHNISTNETKTPKYTDMMKRSYMEPEVRETSDNDGPNIAKHRRPRMS